jgi:hypothetical protein
MKASASSEEGKQEEEEEGPSAGNNLITLSDALEFSGEDDVQQIRELVLRNLDAKDFHPDCAHVLTQLEVLSLSHNNFQTLHKFEGMQNLVELNLNFNQVTSLSGLKCHGLRKLFLSNNRVSSLDYLRNFPALDTLCLYRNSVPDLDAALGILKKLKKLRCLDLDGNPCVLKKKGYKHYIIRALPRVDQLDGDTVQTLDRELSELFFSSQNEANKSASKQETEALVRPSTAPSGLGAPLRQPLGMVGSSSGRDPFSKSPALRGQVKLFRSDFLNNNPILLEYLANETLETPMVNPMEEMRKMQSDAVDADETEHQRTVARAKELSERAKNGEGLQLPQRGGASFVGRLRGLGQPGQNPRDSMGAGGPSGSTKLRSSSAPFPKPPIARGPSPDSSSSNDRPGSGGSSGGSRQQSPLDPSDPHTTIRKLLSLVQVLQVEKEQLQKDVEQEKGCSVDDLMVENRRMRVENANMFVLSEENKALRKKVAVYKAQAEQHNDKHREHNSHRHLSPPSPSSLSSAPSAATQKLEDENRQLQFRLQRANEELELLRTLPMQASSFSATPGDSFTDEMARPKTAAQVLEECEGFDDEITDLIKRNEKSLKGIRRDLKKAKKELGEAPPSKGAALATARRSSKSDKGAGKSDKYTKLAKGERKSDKYSKIARGEVAEKKSGASAADKYSKIARGESKLRPRTPGGLRGSEGEKGERAGTPTAAEAKAKAARARASEAGASMYSEAKQSSGSGLASGSSGTNLLGKTLDSAQDVTDAMKAVAEAQAEMEVLAKARAILETRSGRRPEEEDGEDESESESEDESEEDESEEDDLLIDEKSTGQGVGGGAPKVGRQKRTETAEEKENQDNGRLTRKRSSKSKSKQSHAPDILVIDGSDYVGEYVE